MKIKFIYFVILIFTILSVKAQTTVQIGNTTFYSFLPVNNHYKNYCYSQQIYKQADINEEGYIVKLYFYYKHNSYMNSNDWTIYLGHSDKEIFADQTDWVPLNEMQQVFSGIVPQVSSDSWVEIVLDTAFYFNNTDNLVIAIDENKSSFEHHTTNWGGFQTSQNRGIITTSNTNIDPASPGTATEALYTILPGVKLYFDNFMQNSVIYTYTDGDISAFYESPWVGPSTCPATQTINVPSGNWITGIYLSYDLTMSQSYYYGYERSWLYSPTLLIGEETNTPVSYFIGGTTYNYHRFLDFANGLTGPIDFELHVGRASWGTGGSCNTDIKVNNNTWKLRAFYHAPSCIKPGNLTLNYKASAQASVSWSPPSPSAAQSYEYFISTNSSAPSGNGTQVNDTTILFTGLTPETLYYYWVRSECDTLGYSDWAGDTLTTTAACLIPTNLVVSNITHEDVQLNWTENDTATKWHIEYGIQPLTQGTGTVITTTNKPHVLESLDPTTTYDVYVKSICNANDTSAYSNHESFFTDCAPADKCNLTFTLYDSFGDGWNGATMEVYQFDRLVATLGSSFTSGSSADQVVSLCGDWSFSIVWNQAGTDPEECGLKITNTSGNVLYNRSTIGKGLAGSTIFTGKAFCSLPTCMYPTDFQIIDRTHNSVRIAWHNAVTMPSYGYEYALNTSTTAPSSNGTSIFDTVVSISNLSASAFIVYNFWVRTACSQTEKSEWMGPVTFSLEPCSPYDQCEYTFIMKDNGGDGWNGAYMKVTQDWSGEIAKFGKAFTSGSQYIHTVKTCKTYNYYVNWTEGGTYPNQCGLEIKDNLNNTIYNQYPLSSGQVGTNIHWGTATCLSGTCNKPSNLASSNITQTSVKISWTPPTPAPNNGYRYYYSTSNTGPVEFGSVTTTNTDAEINALNPSTTYYFWVSSICAIGDESSWEGPQTFTTDCNSYSLNYSFDFEFATAICWTQSYSDAITSDRWNVNLSTNAGGQFANEMRAVSQTAIGTSRLISPPINTSGYNTLNLSFKTAFSAFGGQGLSIKIQSSSDKVNWTDEEWVHLSEDGDISATDIDLIIRNNVGATTYLAWVIEGHHGYFNAWYVDEVRINAPPSNPVFEISPVSKTYDSTEVFTANAQHFVITNIGMDTLIITDAQLGGVNASDFIANPANTYPKKLGNGQTDTINVSFEPQTTGQKTATLTVSYNDGTAKSEDVSLSGKAYELPQGSKCYNPLVINSFPFIFNEFSTIYSNDYSSTDITPNSDYLSGNDIVFSFTLTESKRISASIGFGFTGVFLLDACPNSANPPQVIASAFGVAGGSFADKLLQPGQYYLVASCWGPPNEVEIYLDVNLEDPVNLIVSNTHEVINTSANYDNVDVNPDGSLTVESGKTLNVAGNLIIHSDATGTGSLINQGSLNVEGDIIVEKYLPNTSTTGWTLSLPVTSTPKSVFDGSDNIWYFDAASASWQSFTDNDLNIMTGYVVRFPSTTTVEFEGNLMNNDIGKTLYRYTSPNNFGWNYVGNPYPSPIDWDANPGISRTNLNNAIYFRRWDGGVDAYVDGVPVNTGSNIIPSMQAFWVQVTEGQATGNLQITRDAQVHASNNTYKSVPSDVLRLKIKRDNLTDETVVRFRESATNDFDGKFDAYKMFSLNNQQPEIYSMAQGEDLAINALPLLTSHTLIPIGYKTNYSGQLSLEISGQNSFSSNHGIWLEDLSENIAIDLKSNNVYQFNSTTGSNNNRFVLHFTQGTSGSDQNEFTESGIGIFAHENAVCIFNIVDANSTVSIYNLLGQEILVQKLNPNTINRINTNLSTGYYLVKIITLNEGISKKLFLNGFFNLN